ncbi:LOG family protein [uncultured Campylobacter sp.]|uniref:LOG family protein n=1 Tax=uncultured Campylobacter sp. TaxID=218934 RepID=UPI00261A6A86|nr:LOG family protein [uncultured Campylobacter sp.]
MSSAQPRRWERRRRAASNRRRQGPAFRRAITNSVAACVETGGFSALEIRGAFARARTHSVGFNIMLPFEQKSNGFLTQGAKFSAFAPRKGALIENSEIFVIFPGGFGTLDEFFEILVLVQTGFKRARIYLYDEEFYAPLMEFFRTSLLKSGAINESDLQNFKLCDSVDEILTDVRTGENE